MRVYAPAPFRYGGVDYFPGWQEVASDSLVNTLSSLLLVYKDQPVQEFAVERARIAKHIYSKDSNGNILGLVSGDGSYLGQRFDLATSGLTSRSFRGTYGRKVASWTNALQNSAGTATLETTSDLPPFADNATKVLRLTQNATASFGQQNPLDGSQAYMPSGTNPGFSAGIWVKNPGTRTLNFELKFFNAPTTKTMAWTCAIEPTSTWTFLTCSPSQQVNGGSWTFGTDVVAFVRVTQVNTSGEGAWLSGESLLFGNVYVDCAARPSFMIQFDDGQNTQRNPANVQIVSGSAFVSSTLTNVLTTAAAHPLQIGMPIVFTDAAPTSLVVGTKYWVATVPSTTTFTLATDATLATPATTTGFAGTANYQYAGTQQRSGQAIVESYGFRGSLFIVPLWLGTSGKYGYSTGNTFMSGADVQAMYAQGWSVGSHTNTHPSNNENAGLRLLGPYGYYLSNTVDNLSANYVSFWGLGATNRRRVTAGTQASPSVFTTENAHQFLVNMPIVFTDVAPTGCTLGTTYYVASVPTTTTFTLATDQGTLASRVNNSTGAFSGTCNYRYAGSAIDDSAIFADIIAGIAGVLALGIPTGAKYLALPQGAADEFVRSAVIRSGVKWVRGTEPTARSIPLGLPTGAGVSLAKNPSGGWLMQPDALPSDGVTPTITTLKSYVDDVITQGACGCSYHHSVGAASLSNLDNLCAYLRTKVDAGSLSVMTLDEFALAYKF